MQIRLKGGALKNAVLVAGNGPSLKKIDYARLPSEYDVFRSNQFYTEDKYYTGKKIKAIFHTVDFFFDEYFTSHEMVKNNEYQIENIVCKMYNFASRKEKIFQENFKFFFPSALNGYDNFFYKLKELSAKVDFDACYLGSRIEMLTGTYAIACAVACGYKEIYIAGMDFCDEIYSYADGRNIDECCLHHANYDIEILNFLRDVYNAKIFSVCPDSSINKYILLHDVQNPSKTLEIETKSQNSIKTRLMPNKNLRNRYKRIYLEANPFINLFYGFLRTPRALKHYLSSKFYR
ncbi:alpha-2,3-sialyltransferase [Campylobacter ornithocola]|uniref:Alpha-2,3-sialyltransferase n=1 Tax=Campylobacter ornithocola TaxID=1848766 RepID=A0AA91FNC1_9BACT|nr:alpha-2,3-sialyltransferase [Campylobacter ornithocola]OCX42463.1 alpha-2,3-sialyltransferase [Campylobacter ornithocola]HEC1746866.1 alpha-2,3 sialyltransferase [Campylobacter lari]